VEPAQSEITAGEAAAVCAQYDLGVVEQVRPLPRRAGGSSRSGKAILATRDGAYLLKRRPPHADPRRVALSHQVQLHLQAAGFPVPPLVGTRADNNSMVQIADRVYEVFRFIRGEPYDGSGAATAAAGAALARYHRCLLSLAPAWDPPTSSYHASPALLTRFEPAVRRATDSPDDRAAARDLSRLYAAAAREADRLGVASMPRQLVHGDWHPGNILFHPGAAPPAVAAVVDHDAVALWPRILDLAYGALHFSLPRATLAHASERPLTRRDSPDLLRLAAFCRGYHDESAAPISAAEAAALPWLMIEAMVADASAAWAGLGSPSPHVGSAGESDSAGFLGLIARKADWLARHAAAVATIARRGTLHPLPAGAPARGR